MKNLYVLLVALFISSSFNAQIIDIPDTNFKNALINYGVDTSGDGEISISEAEATAGLTLLSGLSISSLEGIEYFVNLTGLNCSNNQISFLDLSNLPNLDFLICSHNQIETLIVGEKPVMGQLEADNNQLTSLDLSGATLIGDLNIYNNQLTYLDLSHRESFGAEAGYIKAQNNQIETLILKNGINDINQWFVSDDSFDFSNNPISYVCGDEDEFDIINEWLNYDQIENCVVSSYCSFNPGGDYYTIEGNTVMDMDDDGCNTNDPIFPNLNFTITDGIETGNFISGSTGAYSIPVPEGTHTIIPTFENPDYFTVTQSSLTVSFPSDTSPYLQDFCISPNGAFNDLEITIIPIDDARPGFDADYKLLYKNKGTTVLSGSIDLTFQDDLMDLVSASPTEDSESANTLTWNFTDLTPFETRAILFTMNINTPTETPPVNGDDVLVFDAIVNSSETDETPNDNTFSLNQTVVNSFDPNDKTCLEGDIISPDMVGDFVHYRIRFENTGTANAINVVVKDNIDRTKYDLSTLVPIDASHDFFARIADNVDDYYVEFIFENIDLPFDDANNDGYVVFKIKTLDTLVLNDTFENEAEIYFDFNFPIITNTAQTTVSTLSTDDFEFTENAINLFPNPAQNTLHLKSKHGIEKLVIYDITGRVIQKLDTGSKRVLDISIEALLAGTYFMEVKTENSKIVKAFIKE